MGKYINLIIIFVLLILIVGAGYTFYPSIQRRLFPQNTTTGDITINFWGVNYPASAIQPVINSYEKLHPNITISYTQQPPDNYKQTALTRINQPSSATPDIIAVNNNWLPLIQGGLAPIPANIYTPKTYASIFYPTAINDFTGTDGKLYAVPSEYDGLGIFYNKALLAAKGYTTPSSDLNQFIMQAQNLTVTDKNGNITQSGLAIGTANNIFNSADILMLFMLQNGVPLTDQTGKVAAFATSGGQEALQYYIDLANKYKLWNSAFPNDIDAFAQGNVAFMYAPIWVVQNIKQENPSLQFDIAPAPQLDKEINLSNYWAYAVPKSSPASLQAWDFIKYMSSPENLQTINQGTQEVYGVGYPYPRKDMATLQENSQFSSAYVKMAPTGTSWRLGDFDSAQAALNKAITNTQNQSEDVQTALNSAAQDVTKELLQY